MTRAQFDTYRGSFNRYLDCVAGSTEAAQCATAWAEDVSSLTGGGMLREHGGKSADCLAC